LCARATKASEEAPRLVCKEGLGETSLRQRECPDRDASRPALSRPREWICCFPRVRFHVLAALVTMRFEFPGASRPLHPEKSSPHSQIQSGLGVVASRR